MTTPRMHGRRTDVTVLAISGGLLVVFVIAALAAPTATGHAVTAGFDLASRGFGALWQVLLLATFAVAVALACSRCGSVRMGDRNRPEYSRFKWIAMIMCTLLAGGGVFFAAAEPLEHFVSPPPLYADVRPGSQEAVNSALAQSFTHWGFLAWAVLGSLGSIVMMRGLQHGMPLRPRTLLYPLLGERIRHSRLGTAVDVTCIIAVVAGTVGPIGFLGLQVSYGLSRVFGTPDTYPVQLTVIVGLTAIAVLSVISGIDRGIQFLSRLNIWLAVLLMLAFLVLGSAGFVLDSFLGGFAQYVRDFVPMALYRGDQQWLGSWTVFFFGWFLGYGPLMAIFVARISRGRTLRDLVVSTAIVPPIATTLWFTVFGGTGILFEQRQPGLLSQPLANSGMDAAVISISEQLPFGGLIAIVLLLLTVTFVATTADSMSYSIAAATTRHGEPAIAVRAFWGVLMGAAAAVLIVIGDGGITALQYFIVVTAVPVGFVMLPTLWTAPRIARQMAIEQGVLPEQRKTSGLEVNIAVNEICLPDGEGEKDSASARIE
ncbi:BCCT family transporter [Allosaccharopolyspora coralli]|uniref:BCCT family transporter n=1 Tax=Allosaccharopolyspora coralli TaxID=2665642 RepID=A0A5Q3Q6F6_9PSEU|nr:BCCT family transporter [Allosaccharopolyspora coralli]QGK70188.1 BCCT family transporter [Allosaccharopolyspora coralli]